jgi:hypothetical protein
LASECKRGNLLGLQIELLQTRHFVIGHFVTT